MPRILEPPNSAFVKATYKLRRMLSLSRAFQIGCNVSNETQAVERIYLRGRQIQSVGPRPFAIVGVGAYQKRAYAGGVQNFLANRGTVRSYVCQDVPEDLKGDPAGSEAHAAEFFASILDEICALSGADDPGSADGLGHLAITDALLDAVWMSPKEDWNTEIGQFHWCEMEFQWEGGS